MKNKISMSVALRPDLQDEVKKIAKIKGLSLSEYVGKILEEAVKIDPNDEMVVFSKSMDEDILPVVLKVPMILKNDPEKLEKWLHLQIAGIPQAVAAAKVK